LPSKFDFGAGKLITILYDATGQKLRKVVSTNGVASLTQDYLGGIELKNNRLESIYNEEGRAYNTSNATQSYPYTWRREYNLKDHLGNTRVVFTDKNNDGKINDQTELLQETHYYPFGMAFGGAWYNDAAASKYKYLYNGKELNEEFGLNLSDYGARWYDAAVGRWWNTDPLAEKSRRYSPYVYGNDNPVRFIDPDGMAAESAMAQAERMKKKIDERNASDTRSAEASQWVQDTRPGNGEERVAKAKEIQSSDNRTYKQVGGDASFGDAYVDCSEFCREIALAFGYDPTRTSYGQYAYYQKYGESGGSNDLANVRVGDFLFWKLAGESQISHTGIFIGFDKKGRMLVISAEKHNLKVSSLQTSPLDPSGTIWGNTSSAKYFVGYGRPLSNQSSNNALQAIDSVISQINVINLPEVNIISTPVIPPQKLIKYRVTEGGKN
jgi:RHS repeat-associated protein